MHQDDERLGILVLPADQGLDHQMLIQPQLARRFATAAVLDIVVHQLGKRHFVRLEQLGGRGFADVGFIFFAMAAVIAFFWCFSCRLGSFSCCDCFALIGPDVCDCPATF